MGSLLHERFQTTPAQLEQLQALVARFGDAAPEQRRQAEAAAFALEAFAGHHDAFSAHRESAARYVRTGQDHARRTILGSVLIMNDGVLQNELARCRRILAELSPREDSSPAVATTFFHLFAAFVAFLEGDFGESARQVGAGIELADRSSVHSWDLHLLSIAHHAANARGDRAEEDRVLGAIGNRTRSARPGMRGLYHQCAGWTAYSRRAWLEARRHCQLALDCAKEIGVNCHDARLTAVLSSVELELGQPDTASRMLGRAKDCALRFDDRNSTWLLHLIEADLALCQGSDPTEIIETALAHARRHGIVVTTMWRRDLVARVLTAAIERDIEAPYALHLIELHDLLPDPPPLHSPLWPYRCRLHAFGGFDVMVSGQPLRETKKALSHPLRMLQKLVTHGGRGVGVDTLAEASGRAMRWRLPVRPTARCGAGAVRETVASATGAGPAPTAVTTPPSPPRSAPSASTPRATRKMAAT